jgi:hypothetical protein
VAALTAPPAVLLGQHRPVLVYDDRERDFATSVARWRDPGAAHPDVVYGRAVRDGGRTWLQYWLFSRYNAQDRGIVKTGRHEGDWEFVQLGLDSAGRPRLITLAQHSWAEGCAAGAARPTIYVANGSHASYLTRGEHGRPWPDPDDEARGDGRRVHPRLIVMRDQSWLRYGGRWGGSRASWIPSEQSSPPGPRFQDDGRWTSPAAYARSARACGSGAPGRPLGLTLAVAAIAAALLAAAARRLRG